MKKQFLTIGGIATLVLLLAGAAFIGAQLLSGKNLQLPNGQSIHFGFGGNNAQRCNVTRVRAADLPGPPIMRRAVLVRRQNNSIFIGVPLRDVVVKPNGTASQSSGFDGPVVEVVVTHTTKLYQDVTFRNYNGPCGQVQQVLEPGDLKDISDETTFLVWGERNGDRVSANYLVYELPPVGKPGVGK